MLNGKRNNCSINPGKPMGWAQREVIREQRSDIMTPALQMQNLNQNYECVTSNKGFGEPFSPKLLNQYRSSKWAFRVNIHGWEESFYIWSYFYKVFIMSVYKHTFIYFKLFLSGTRSLCSNMTVIWEGWRKFNIFDLWFSKTFST